MLDTILGQKGKMSQSFIEARRVPVTKVMAGPCVVTQLKTPEKDGYWAVQLGFGEKKIKNVTKPLQGHLKGAITKNTAPRFLKEVRVSEDPGLKVGDKVILSDVFKVGDFVAVVGTSKGKGFQGVVKRWGFHGGPRTHGQSDRERAPGSIGQTTTPGRVFKGKHMAGRMGADRVTVKDLQVVSVDPEKGEIEISGAIPGPSGGLVMLKRLSSGELEGIEEVQAQVVEGEAPAGEEAEAAGESKPEGEAPAAQETPKTPEAAKSQGGKNA
ncbi:MAG: 50S ribosomal protein L3 [Candidatus Woesebacteria bacterium GW2011_GWA1_45_8]|uniref:Large ribosomal subunit protein uL3 n=1 Tax=Candidatus Woesebacteria bacterium GW2011_GWA1_45_8 TaxID=1618559 RepID=A0A0G1MVN6_9BACT|nr:MAG: 50S ribosomal protein L3 [Candidatus Woesebacteria bacterium GW2011_GWA1_45_8]